MHTPLVAPLPLPTPKPSIRPTASRLGLRACAAFALALLLALPLQAAAQTAWLFGEQHDQRDQQRQVAQQVQAFASQGRLRAVVIEMALRGRSTAGLPRDASEAAVREALAWNEAGWPWEAYRPVVMNAVRAGVPVTGGDVAREALRGAMREVRWDAAVPAAAQALLLTAVREGHCGLVPEAHLGGMVRMQIARDRSLAEALAEAARGAGRDEVVLLLAGAAHASRETGVPLHLGPLAPQLTQRTVAFSAETSLPGFDEVRPAQRTPSPDHCAELRQRGMPSIAPGGATGAPSPATSPSPAAGPPPAAPSASSTPAG